MSDSHPPADPDRATPAADPRRVPGIPFSARRLASGDFRFEAPAFETETLLEASPDDLARMLTGRAIPFVGEDGPAFWDSVQRSAADLTPWRREIHVRGQKTGREMWVRVHAVPAREPDGGACWTGLLVDVTDLKEAEGRAERAYRQLSAHLDNTPLAVVEWDGDSVVRRWSGQAEVLFGWSAEEAVGRKVFDFPLVHPDDVGRVTEVMAGLVERRAAHSWAVNRNLTKAGEVLTCEWYNSVVFDECGNLVSVLSQALDVTERARAQAALARSESFLRSALDAALMIVWEWDAAADRFHYSSDYAAFFGLPAGPDYGVPEVAGRAVHPTATEAVREEYHRCLSNGDDLRVEFRGAAAAAGGEPRWFSCRGRVFRDAAGRAVRVRAVTTDASARKRAEREKELFERRLQEAQKLESLGVLAGGIAHDFNNLLTVVLGNAALARKAAVPESPSCGYLDQIETACQRAANLCRQMLAYAGRGHVSHERTDLNRLIRETAPLLNVSADGAVRIEFNLAEPLPAVVADGPQLRQVLLNLVSNGTESIGARGGTVYVRTGTATVAAGDSGAGFQPVPAPGRYAFLDVADNGPGMADEVRARIFEPFFTTKFAGRGLGLPAVLGIVRSHGGSIRVDSAAGRGTLFRVLWPAAGDGAPAPSPSSVLPAPPPRRRPADAADAPRRHAGAALVVDDEMYVREVAASTVEEMGFAPLVADGGPAALDLFERHRAELRLAVVDVLMPGMSGPELLGRIRALDPQFPVVLVSGFTDRGLVGPAPGTGRTLFLQKPFRPEELMAAVAAVLE